MTRALLAEFPDGDAIRAAVEAARKEKVALIDAYTPFPVAGLGEAVDDGKGAFYVRLAMLIGGLGTAACTYALQTYAAVWAYPFDSGGRPPNSWPVFMMFPFEFGILSAGVCGLIALFFVTGLPRLNHPLFAVEGFARTSNDRFVLMLEPPRTSRKRARLSNRLMELGAIAVKEVEL